MIRFRNKNWELAVTRNMNLFQCCLDVAGHYLRSKNYGLPAYEHVFVIENGLIMYAHHNKKNADNYHKKIIELCLNTDKFDKLKPIYDKYGKALFEASIKLEKKAGKQEYKNFINAEMNLSAGLYLTTAIGRLMHNLLIEKLKFLYPALPQSEIEMLISDITYPAKQSPLTASRIDLLALGAYLQKNKIKFDNIESSPEATKKLNAYCKKYHFIPVNFNEDPWTPADIMEQLIAFYKNDCRKEKENILRSHAKKIKNAELKLKKINNTEITKLSKVLQTGTILNEYRKLIFCRASLAYRPLFKKIAIENGLKNWRDCWKLTPEELFDLYFKKNKKIIQTLKKRDWAGIIYSKSELGYKILDKKEIELFIEEIQNSKSNKGAGQAGEIKGIIANRGNIAGTVRIILSKKDFDKFKDGDIIVAPMTSVDFVPLMERAGAFIINEGGITSHASIVSRELNKPCIIGTKIATQVLKDGDLVEVDADRGVVKIIKRK